MARQALLQAAVGIRREALGAQGDGLVQAHTLADHGGLADHDAGAVVDEEAGADLRARVDVDAGGGMRQFGDDARQQRQPEFVQAVRQAVVDHRQHAGIAQQHFVDAARGRVPLVGGQHVAVDFHADLRQGGAEGAGGVDGLAGDVAVGALLQRGAVVQLDLDLAQQGVQGGIEGVGDVEVFAFPPQAGRPQAHGKQHALELADDFRQRIARRKFNAAYLAGGTVGLAPLLAGVVQVAHDRADVEVSHQFFLE